MQNTLLLDSCCVRTYLEHTQSSTTVSSPPAGIKWPPEASLTPITTQKDAVEGLVVLDTA